MPFYKQSRTLPARFRLILTSFLQRPGLPFADALSEEAIQRAFDDEDVRFADDEDAVYTPAITLWAFLSQVLFKDEQRSCVAAVARIVVLLVVLERGPCSSNTGAYCRARGKLSENVIHRLTVDLANGCERQIDEPWLWRGRHVYLVDGTTVSMPDTPENQEVYPQLRLQQKGLGFPIARVVVLMSLATGMLKDMALGPYTGKETGETALLRSLLKEFEPGDILLADRYYCSYFMIALLMELGIDFVTRVHQLRTVDFRRGRRLGKGDHIVQWKLPQKPKWMDQKTYDRMPAQIEVREVHVHVGQPGFRTESFVVVTTLTDAAKYATADLAELYHCRWLAEQCFREEKDELGFDHFEVRGWQSIHRHMYLSQVSHLFVNKIRQQLATEESAGNRAAPVGADDFSPRDQGGAAVSAREPDRRSGPLRAVAVVPEPPLWPTRSSHTPRRRRRVDRLSPPPQLRGQAQPQANHAKNSVAIRNRRRPDQVVLGE